MQLESRNAVSEESKEMTSIRLTDDLNSYLNRNANGAEAAGAGLSSYFNRENFISNKLNESIGSWFGAPAGQDAR